MVTESSPDVKRVVQEALKEITEVKGLLADKSVKEIIGKLDKIADGLSTVQI